ncbi:aminotransferase class III-fold pyridoxal phosphate-dependent enzyme [Fulvivirga maritima]|uniref:aspartate aminotransferase family protein n=1 Tax=Fulvivirga maritima TaxID=2904247 RepID=UPI001F1BA78A|nr:aminotransferase class III-fold pyridoxal phosphate-dependent enzyme [Fulvivirga maritima]UII24542.1 aminotransferase class III-fold pyridoxal phosphate-dependent enzyme [Fulvivirga maritima]
MKPFDVYPLLDIEPVKAEGCKIIDKNGVEYLDFYGGHAVISIGHSHPVYVKKITEQLQQLGFYSNSVQIPLQKELAEKLGQLSDYEDYDLFLCNSGAEANENALKLASFHTNKSKVVAFKKAFHGRTSAAVGVTDNPNYSAPINKNENTVFLELNDLDAVEDELSKGNVCAVIIEGIQGVGGIHIPEDPFLRGLSQLCKEYNAILILDEVQSGYGRTGKFFAHQYAQIKPDLITTAKGMGNGFPIGGVLVSPAFEAKHGQLGTTFGGNHLACAAVIAVLDVLDDEKLISNAAKLGNYFLSKFLEIPEIKEIRGRGLMIALEFDFPIKKLRQILLQEEHVFTGVASHPNVLRLLPPLSLSENDANLFIQKLNTAIGKLKANEEIHLR